MQDLAVTTVDVEVDVIMTITVGMVTEADAVRVIVVQRACDPLEEIIDCRYGTPRYIDKDDGNSL